MKREDLIAISETDKVLKSMLNRYWFGTFAGSGDNMGIELFLKASCKSNCPYCYLHRFRNELYPMAEEKDEKILENLRSVLRFYVENNFKCHIELFSGRIFDTDFGIQVLEEIYNTFSNPFMANKPACIIVPDDMQFILDDNKTAQIEMYIHKFKDINIDLLFSASVDGKIIDYKRFGDRVDEFYDKLKKFCETYKFCYHPMVSAHAIEDWIENFKWWVEYTEGHLQNVMFLEVRNNDWTPDKIKHFLLLLDCMSDYYIEKMDDEELREEIFMQSGDTFKVRHMIECRTSTPIGKDRLTCGGVQQNLCIRLADLSLPPCHRLGYQQYVTGRFLLDENHDICGVESNNVPMRLTLLNSRLSNMPRCTDCLLNNNCLGPCLGANFEEVGDPLYTPDTVCELLKHEWVFLMMKYNERGYLTWLEEAHPQEYENITPSLQYISELVKTEDPIITTCFDILKQNKSFGKPFKKENEEDELF